MELYIILELTKDKEIFNCDVISRIPKEWKSK